RIRPAQSKLTEYRGIWQERSFLSCLFICLHESAKNRLTKQAKTAKIALLFRMAQVIKIHRIPGASERRKKYVCNH
ncbi:MAG: hypothetical protein IJM42_01600, partial [Synergistes sp.]|nr:hypothetical protein [Synergistes sp.]